MAGPHDVDKNIINCLFSGQKLHITRQTDKSFLFEVKKLGISLVLLEDTVRQITSCENRNKLFGSPPNVTCLRFILNQDRKQVDGSITHETVLYWNGDKGSIYVDTDELTKVLVLLSQ